MFVLVWSFCKCNKKEKGARQQQARNGTNRKEAPEKPLSPFFCWDNEHQGSDSSGEHQAQTLFWLQLLSELGNLLLCLCLKTGLQQAHGASRAPQIQPLVHESWKHCLFSKAKLLIQTLCVDSVKSVVLGEGRAHPTYISHNRYQTSFLVFFFF